MLVLPQGDSIMRLIAIDPGTDTLGTALFEMDLEQMSVAVVDAVTYTASKHVKISDRYLDYERYHGSRSARLYAHMENLLSLFDDYQPHHVASESPFMHRQPQAFEALVECLSTIRLALHHYDPYMVLLTVPPHTAKKAIGITKADKTKDQVRSAITELLRKPEQHKLYYKANTPFEQLDEHSLDAIAVGYYQFQQIVEAMMG